MRKSWQDVTDKITDADTTIEDVVPLYVDLIRGELPGEQPPPASYVNALIRERWSENAVVYIKRSAWELVGTKP